MFRYGIGGGNRAWRWLGLAACLVLPMAPAMAEDWQEAQGLSELLPGGGPNQASFMKRLRLTVAGWIDAGLTYNPAAPGDRFNGTTTFNDRNLEFQLNQLYAYLERPVDIQGEHWDVGGRADFLYGTDAVFTQAFGDPSGHWDGNLLGGSLRFYQLAIPQAYLDVVAPVGNGLRVKLGHFYTIIGNESVMAPDDFFYSHTYLMQYGEPFTHTGLLASYAPIESVTVTAGAATGSLAGGWDGVFDRDLTRWSFLGGVTWTSDSTTVSANASHGGVNAPGDGDWSLYSLVFHRDFGGGWHATTQHDYGWVTGVSDGGDAQWYGIAQYLEYDVLDNLTVGLRGEWFRDDDGTRVLSRVRVALHPAAGGRAHLASIASLGPDGETVGNTYYGLTAGVVWKPVAWVMVRPNVRYDWSDAINMYDCTGGGAPPVCADGSQWLVSLDAVLSF